VRQAFSSNQLLDAVRTCRRMIARFLLRLALLWFVTGVVSPAVGESLHATSDNQADHSGSPCSDPDAGGEPCGPACPCACCPGHRTPPALAVGDAVSGALIAGQFEAGLPDTLHPKDVFRRVFHPPRA
jgi:hypothetical protein